MIETRGSRSERACARARAARSAAARTATSPRVSRASRTCLASLASDHALLRLGPEQILALACRHRCERAIDEAVDPRAGCWDRVDPLEHQDASDRSRDRVVGRRVAGRDPFVERVHRRSALLVEVAEPLESRLLVVGFDRKVRAWIEWLPALAGARPC